jgi:hypothetical protein
LAGKSVDDIIKGWRDQLESHAQAFVAQAAVLQQWDAAVLSNRQVLMGVEGELRGVHAKQEGLDRQLCQIETHQKASGGPDWRGNAGCAARATTQRGRPVSSPAHPQNNHNDTPQPLTPPHPPTPTPLIINHRQEVHDALSSIEAEAERLFGAERRLMDADAQERDRLYARAQQVRVCAAVARARV